MGCLSIGSKDSELNKHCIGALTSSFWKSPYMEINVTSLKRNGVQRVERVEGRATRVKSDYK